MNNAIRIIIKSSILRKTRLRMFRYTGDSVYCIWNLQILPDLRHALCNVFFFYTRDRFRTKSIA